MTEEKDFYEAIINKKDLSEREFRNLLDYEVDRSYGDNRRWTREVSSILKLCGHLFELDWDEGLTEYQDDVFFDLPYEVVKEEKQVTTTVVTYVPLKEN